MTAIDPRYRSLTFIIYGLHLFSVFAGIASAGFILVSFLTGWPSVLAVILNYVFRSKVRGTYLATHFVWQIRTFWYALLWSFILILMIFTIIGIPLAFTLAVLLGLWIVYRVLRGCWNLLAEKPMPTA